MRKSYFIAETAFHHEGDADYLKSLIDQTKQSGADGIKFQVLTEPRDFLSTRHSAYERLASFCLSLDQWKRLFDHTQQTGLDIILMPLNLKALELCRDFDIRFMDIHSVLFNDYELLAGIKSKALPVILGVGGREVEEIAELIHFFDGLVEVLMAGFQSYPSDLKKVRLGRISGLRLRWPELCIGYADHSSYLSEFCLKSSEYARLLGANLFEKHVTLREGEVRTDYEAAVSFEKLKEMIASIRFLDDYVMPSPDDFTMTAEELRYRQRQLQCVARSGLRPGQRIEAGDVRLKMIDQADGLARLEEAVGRVVGEAIEPDGLIRGACLMSETKTPVLTGQHENM